MFLFLTSNGFCGKVATMLILGIETSTKTGSVAVVSDSGVVAQYSLNIEVTHSERLMSTVDRVLKDTGMTLSRIDGFAVATGPGSFTGLRIGVSTVKGLAFATGKPVAAVPTLYALAWNVPHAAFPVCPLLDARKNEVYAAVYISDGSVLHQTAPEAVVPLSRLADLLSGKTVFTGEASILYRGDLEKLFGNSALFAPRSAVLPAAAAVAEIGLDMIRTGRQTDIDSLAPLYIRRPEAEVAWEKKMQSQ
jgi:tRNA threonylcarbamoyladenosine biosynthesis protein TsaB